MLPAQHKSVRLDMHMADQFYVMNSWNNSVSWLLCAESAGGRTRVRISSMLSDMMPARAADFTDDATHDGLVLII